MFLRFSIKKLQIFFQDTNLWRGDILHFAVKMGIDLFEDECIIRVVNRWRVELLDVQGID